MSSKLHTGGHATTGAAAYAAATQLRCVWSPSNRGQIIIDLIRDLQAGSQVARHLIHSVGFVIFESMPKCMCDYNVGKNSHVFVEVEIWFVAKYWVLSKTTLAPCLVT